MKEVSLFEQNLLQKQTEALQDIARELKKITNLLQPPPVEVHLPVAGVGYEREDES